MKVRKGWEADAHCNGCLASIHTITYDTEEQAVNAAAQAWNCRFKPEEHSLLNPAGQYACKFAENHGISVAEAMKQPMVRARFEYFNQTGA